MAYAGKVCGPDETLCALVHWRWTLVIVTSLAFTYMGVFVYENRQILLSKPNVNLKYSIEGFLFGVNIPSILAFVLVVIGYCVLVTRSNDFQKFDVFLSGATALLVFASSAAAICMNHYIEAFQEYDAAPCAVPSIPPLAEQTSPS